MLFIQLKNLTLQGVKTFGCNVIQVANITGRATRGGPLSLPKGFDYENRRIWRFHRVLDSTMKYIGQENAKILVVEGPIGVGKTAVAKALAEEFDMKYMPQPTMDDLLILPSGYDLRQHDDELPPEVRSYDHKNFCTAPKDIKCIKFQLNMLFLRYFQYLDGMCHLLNTGQGIVLERSYFSDYVFANAMYEHKFFSKEAKMYYDETCLNTSTNFLPPHLIVYLDIPVEVVQKRIKDRNLSYEQNSPALTKSYLESLERNWKQDYLKKASEKSEILIYKWDEGGDIDLVIEDIEKIDFNYLRRDDRFKDWQVPRNYLFYLRRRFTNDKKSFEQFFFNEWWKVPEFNFSTWKNFELDRILQKLPECKYEPGYNPAMGDSILKILFKTKVENRRSLKRYLDYHTGTD